MEPNSRVLGIDIGGANTKIASPDGQVVQLQYIPLWKQTTLPQALKEIAVKFSPERVGVVITGELADCFTDKEEGVQFIMDAVGAAFPDVLYLNNRGEFITGGQDADYRSLAAANWMASAMLVGKDTDCIFVDMGSTTTDLIPVKDGQPLAGMTDLDRLGRHELLYMGVLRTNIAALLDRVDLDKTRYRVASELFAQTGDVHLLLDNIGQEDYTCDTADGGGRTKEDAARRLARVVCADTTELGIEKIMAIAEQAYARQKAELAGAMEVLASQHGIASIVGAGLGEFLIRDAAQEAGLECTPVSEEFGSDISKVFPAYAVARLVDGL